MVVSAEQARLKAEARRQRILAKSAERLDVVSQGMASQDVQNSVPLAATANKAAVRRRRQNQKKNEGGDNNDEEDNDNNAIKKNEATNSNEPAGATKEPMPSDKKGKPSIDPDPSVNKTATSITTSNDIPLNDASPKHGGKSTTSSTSSKKSYYVNFLSTYEEMVRQQDYEYDVTTKHLKGVFDRVQYLGRNSRNKTSPQDGRHQEGILTYSQIRRCLLRMNITWNRSLPTLIDDDVSVNSINSSSAASGGSGSGSPFHTTAYGGRKRDILTTDAQLIMLLTALVEAEERYRLELANMTNNEEDDDDVERRGIYFPEFVQSYQLIVAGMQSLQVLDVGEDVIKAQIVDRVKERTFGLLRPFGPDSMLYKEFGEEEGEAVVSGGDADGLLPSSKRSYLIAKGKSMRENDDKEGLDENELKSLMQSKDSRLAMLIQEHEEEMDVLAKGLESLRSKQASTRKLMKLRRGLLFVGATILGVGVLVFIVMREHQRRVDVEDGIAALREAERKANAKTIAKLTEQRDVLERKVGDTEGTMRYLVERNKGVDASTKEIEAEIERVDMKYLIDVADFQRCGVQEKELGDALTVESAKKMELDEELGWCQSRSHFLEKELNTLEHANTDQGVEEDHSGMSGDQVLHLEMKYNNSTRHAVTVRQAYSAAAGLVVSTTIHRLLPFAAKLFAPKPIQVVQVVAEVSKRSRFFPWLRRRKQAELAVVDGVFGGSIAYLVIRAIALFIFP
ncbi:hypothetical protein ACHAWT_002220 [Skeletonema menzelii]